MSSSHSASQDEPERRVVWKPNPGPQTQFLSLGCFEALYGGAAGGGKSDALLIAPLRHVHVPSFRAILFRRTFPELEKSLIDRSRLYYKPAFPSARYNGQQKCWHFPSGARIYFGHLEYAADVHTYQSAEFQFVGFDELTSFEESQYVYMQSRLRGEVRPILRSATNPGGEGHDWVFARFRPWLDSSPEYTGPKASGGQVLHFRVDIDPKDPTRSEEKLVPRGTLDAVGRCFIPAKATDNPVLMARDPQYIARLRAQNALDRAHLLDGNWLAKLAAGLLFKRGWFQFTDAVPAHAARVRYWDRAATEEKIAKGHTTDPDWTVGLLLSEAGGTWVVEDVCRMRGTPAEVKEFIRATAEADDAAQPEGAPRVTQVLSLDPGSAGKFEAHEYISFLKGFDVHAVRESGDKVTRAKPVSAQAEVGNIKLFRGPWNRAFLDELEEFPTGRHDDQVDAFSGAFSQLLPAPTMSGGMTTHDLESTPLGTY